MSIKIKNIREQFTKSFILVIILETILRFLICLSFPNKIYAFILAGILTLFISLYILYIKKALKEFYAIIIVLAFYFFIHFAYIIGTYQFVPIMLLWLLVVPIAARIYFSNKISLIVCFVIALSAILITKVLSPSDILIHYKDIVLDYYGILTAAFI